MHYIRYDVLYGYVLSRLQYWSEQVHRDDEKLLQQLLNAGYKECSATKKQRAVELKKATKRKAEVDGLFTKMYEDWSLEKITEYNFTMLSAMAECFEIPVEELIYGKATGHKESKIVIGKTTEKGIDIGAAAIYYVIRY